MKRFDGRAHYVCKEARSVPMPDKDKKQQPQAADETTAPELNNPDFQVVLKALLSAYQPVLEQQLNLAKNPQELQREAQNHPPTVPMNLPKRMRSSASS
jgi:hypothetical protein